ncbi:MAG: ThiF family adenylyltransferase [Burkholderiales bacterium]
MNKPTHPKKVIIRFTARAYERVRRLLLKDENEQMCFVFAHVVETPTPNRLVFLCDYVLQLHDSCYLKRTPTSVVLDHRAKNIVYARFAASTYDGLLNIHSHPFDKGRVAFSSKDDEDDLREIAWQYEQLPRGKRAYGNPRKVHCLSMVFGQRSLDARGLTCRHLGFQEGLCPPFYRIEQVQILGEKLSVITPTGATNSPTLSSSDRITYDRQILAFGAEGQKTLGSLHISLIGTGGIGSILGEGVCRMGVKTLTLIDHDLLSPHSLNRWQGGRPSDIGKPKAQVLATHLRRMFPGIKVTSIAKPLTHPKALKAIKGADFLLAGVDNHQARWLLNRISAQFLIPYLDGATVIAKGKGEANNRMQLFYRLAVVVPGITACLSCSQIKYWNHQEDIAPYLYDPITRSRLQVSGYIQDHPEEQAPSVMPLNMLVAASVLLELLNLVTDYAPLARNVAVDHLSPNHTTVRSDTKNFPEGPAEDCISCFALLGKGNSEPLPVIDMPALTESQIDNHFPLAANE